MRTNFKFENENITMVKGDTLAFNVEIFDDNGSPVTVDTAYFTCKKIATGNAFIFQKSIGDGIVQDSSLLTVRVAPEDTAEATAGEYFYDFQIGVNNDVYTLRIGTLTLVQDITF